MDASTLQRALAARGLYPHDEIDGDLGPKSEAAISALIAANLTRIPVFSATWSPERCRMAAEQIILKDDGFDPGTVDGLTGPRTEAAQKAWAARASKANGAQAKGASDAGAARPEPVSGGGLALAIKAGRLYRGGKPVQFIATPNMSGALKPEGIILHDTAGPSLSSATGWLSQSEAKASAHVVVDLDGTIVQMVPFDRVAWHAGPSSYKGRPNCNSFTVGIEIVNPGALSAAGKAWFHKTGQAGYSGIVHKATKAHGDGWWLPYTPEQIEAVTALCKALAAAYPSISFISTHWEISPGRKVDTNPLFPLGQVRGEVLGELVAGA
jgi:N-acetylmuramoyl-L-alanine amidase